MKFEVQATSKDIIKPSSPTANHLRHYKLSFLDQITVNVYGSVINFYTPNSETMDIPNRLKQSLSDLLTYYYPLAGRANHDDSFIDCNDEGVPFFESCVNCKLSDFIQNSSIQPNDLNKLVPFELDNLTDISMGVQLSMFECGGFAIGVCISHNIGDALSFFSITNNWAAISRGESRLVCPHFTSAKLFPPTHSTFFKYARNNAVNDIVARRFMFNGSEVEEIREKYAGSKIMENQRRPSRVEALSAFLYSRFVAAIKEDNRSCLGSDKLYLVCHAVNIRSKIEPPLPQYAIGNYYRSSFAVPSKEILNDEHCYGLVDQVRQEISKIDKEFVKMFQEENKELENMKELISSRFRTGEPVTCNFTSLCRMPIYEADFGWGNPIWVGLPALTRKNFIVFVDKNDGDGIEVYIHLKEEHMKKLESDIEFMKYVNF